ncbi:ABC transporter ATP-binding protein/permease [Cellulomonas sp. PSBB021]|uniref:ABC transporter ATP-binding protein/permease n=1 Tax=Cellulomonas sp. PSBB021 TaxID=2003551 RepID=UPI000B8D56B0|nr:ABC transporter ATP-binding protein/permease [Cellulomonas sp. PSBB021]ASR55846.1 hypothetical protein CBP52_12880 [Cellulomonas sp. PSBB021]
MRERSQRDDEGTGGRASGRLSTVRLADQVVVLDAGRVVEQGSHADLVATDGPYARLWTLQSRADTT